VVENGATAAVETIRKAAGREFDVRPSRWDRAGATVHRRT
jgi:hypothetical protein